MPKAFLITNRRYHSQPVGQVSSQQHRDVEFHPYNDQVPLPRHFQHVRFDGNLASSAIACNPSAMVVETNENAFAATTPPRSPMSPDVPLQKANSPKSTAHMSRIVLDDPPEYPVVRNLNRQFVELNEQENRRMDVGHEIQSRNLASRETILRENTDFGDKIYKPIDLCKKFVWTEDSETSKSKLAPEENHVCSECGKRYSTSSNLARHRQTHRSITDKKARKCPHCDKVYVSMPAFSMHVRTHNQGCQCPHCGKCFSRPWLLQGHIRTHTGEKPFKCSTCGKAFADKSNLRAHIQTHSTTKPYICGRCGKAFALKSYLYKHEESSCMRINRNTHRQIDDEIDHGSIEL
ncbi:Uncharacterised protein g10254 [Pycnogonum litorale]